MCADLSRCAKAPRLSRYSARTLRDRLRIIFFDADTKAGRRFDVALIVMILFSVVTVMLDSVPEINVRYEQQLYSAEWAFTLLFTA